MPERIVVLDGHTLNPGDLDWRPLEQLGALTLFERSTAEQVVARCSGASCVLTNKTPLSREVISALPGLRYVGVLATGYNVVDTGACAERGIVVTNIPAYGTDSVAQHVAALMLEFARGVGVHDRAVHLGEWEASADWCFARRPIFELSGKTLGIVGLGRIGLTVARIGAALGMVVVASDPVWPPAQALAGVAVTRMPLDELFRNADVISLHCPLTADNHHLVDASRLASMKPSAFLVNTSRGQLVDNAALAQALVAGIIAGAALDVLDVEPPPASNPLLHAPNCIITPHIAWYAREARERLMQIAVANLAAFLQGSPVNRVA